DLVLDVEGPGGITATRVLLSGATLAAGATATPVFRVRVPASAPVGTYSATASAVTGGGSFSAPFSFEIAGTARVGGGEAFAVEVVDDGGLVAAAVSTPEAPALAPVVAPNPMRGEGRVRYTLAGAAHATLAVYDLLGRRVATLHEGRQEAGAHEARFDARALGLSGGVY